MFLIFNIGEKMINIKYKIVDVDVPVFVPEYKTQGSSGMDICSSYEYIIPPAHTVVVKTNISVEIPNGFEIQIRSRSGMSANHSVFVLNGVGTIDSDYTGEIMVILHNAGKNDFKAKKRRAGHSPGPPSSKLF